MGSALQNEEVVDAYLQDELAKSNMLVPFTLNSVLNVYINRIRVITKKQQVGKWCLITDLPYAHYHISQSIK